jgi:hypothetical protein
MEVRPYGYWSGRRYGRRNRNEFKNIRKEKESYQ